MFKKESDKLSLFPDETEVNAIPTIRKNENIIQDKKAVAYWGKCLEIIRDNVEKQVFRTWFEPIMALKWENRKLTILVPSQFFFEWIEEHYYDLLQQTMLKVLGEGSSLQYQIVVDESEDSLENRTIKLPGLSKPPSSGGLDGDASATDMVSDEIFSSNLNPRYSFENFITGESNQLARSAALAISQNPGGTRFNPLVLYGETGLGKTHLAQALGNQIIRTNDKSKVLYTNSEKFTMEFVNAIQNNKTNEFTNFYRQIDTLIVDDIQFFSGKEKTQDNFFHTFNALHQAGKQIILTSDRPPKELSGVDDRLISRFQWGLTADIQQPDLEMRMAILQRKSLDEGFELSTDVIEYIARHARSNIRELEGILISLIAKVTFDGRELDLDLAKEVVHGQIKIEDKPLTIDDIKDYVSKFYDIPVEMLESKSRKHEIALARQMAMYLAKNLTDLSLKNIGKNFGGRDHSTVLHSYSAIENYLVTDKEVKSAFETLLRKLKNDY